MSNLAYTLTDSATMLRRNMKHQIRYASVSIMLIGMPLVFLLLFVYVFGGQLGTDLGQSAGPPHGRGAYVAYVTRFRTMSIARGAVLTGHVLGTLLQAMLGLLVVGGVAAAIGFRPDTGAHTGWRPSACCYFSASR